MRQEPQDSKDEPPAVFKVIGGIVVGIAVLVLGYCTCFSSSEQCHYDTLTNTSIITEVNTGWGGDVSGSSRMVSGNACD